MDVKAAVEDAPASPRTRARLREIVVGLAVGVTGVAIIVLASGMDNSRATDAFGSSWWPSTLGGVIALLGVAVAVSGAVRPRPTEEEPSTIRGGIRVLLVFALVVVYGVAWQFIHFVPVTLVLAAGAVWILGERRWKALVLFPVAVTAILYLLFGVLLGVPV